MSDQLSDFEEGLASAIAEYVAGYKFFQKDEWFSLSCQFRRNRDGTANVSDVYVEPGEPIVKTGVSATANPEAAK